MSIIQPVKQLKNFMLRHKAYGVERRRNMSKRILEKSLHFPLPVNYADIDAEFMKWVDKGLDITYDGKHLPMYKLFSTQRISEYSQTWQNTDDSGSIVMNFKTVTRESNPQHGQSQGGVYNIPGHRDYAMFRVPVLMENGQEGIEVYSMKQPFAVDLIYSVSIVCNQYSLLNEFNQMIQYQFSALENYIYPNEHPMPMLLDQISDESEYAIDDRKYYSQTFKIKVLAYIINEGDFKVTKMPERIMISNFKTSSSSSSSATTKFNLDTNVDFGRDLIRNKIYCNEDKIKVENINKEDIDNTPNYANKPKVEITEEYLSLDECNDRGEDGKYHNKRVNIVIDFTNCVDEVEFQTDINLYLDTISLDNVHDFRILVNGEKINLDGDIYFFSGDILNVKMTREKEYDDSSITLICYDTDSVIDKTNNSETALDGEEKSINVHVTGDNLTEIKEKE